MTLIIATVNMALTSPSTSAPQHSTAADHKILMLSPSNWAPHLMQHGANGGAPGQQVIHVEQSAERLAHGHHLTGPEVVLEPAAPAVHCVRQHLRGILRRFSSPAVHQGRNMASGSNMARVEAGFQGIALQVTGFGRQHTTSAPVWSPTASMPTWLYIWLHRPPNPAASRPAPAS